jgi:hypothetical protein
MRIPAVAIHTQDVEDQRERDFQRTKEDRERIFMKGEERREQEARERQDTI